MRNSLFCVLSIVIENPWCFRSCGYCTVRCRVAIFSLFARDDFWPCRRWACKALNLAGTLKLIRRKWQGAWQTTTANSSWSNWTNIDKTVTWRFYCFFFLCWFECPLCIMYLNSCCVKIPDFKTFNVMFLLFVTICKIWLSDVFIHCPVSVRQTIDAFFTSYRFHRVWHLYPQVLQFLLLLCLCDLSHRISHSRCFVLALCFFVKIIYPFLY